MFPPKNDHFKNSEFVKNLNHGMHDMDYQRMTAFFATIFYHLGFVWSVIFYSLFFTGFITILHHHHLVENIFGVFSIRVKSSSRKIQVIES